MNNRVVLLYSIPLHSFLETSSQAVQWLRWLVTRLPPLRPGFALRKLNVGLMVNNLALGFSCQDHLPMLLSISIPTAEI
jgi:hypothetical protein